MSDTRKNAQQRKSSKKKISPVHTEAATEPAQLPHNEKSISSDHLGKDSGLGSPAHEPQAAAQGEDCSMLGPSPRLKDDETWPEVYATQAHPGVPPGDETRVQAQKSERQAKAFGVEAWRQLSISLKAKVTGVDRNIRQMPYGYVLGLAGLGFMLGRHFSPLARR